MTDPRRPHPRYESLRSSRAVLTRMAPVVRFGLLSLGASLFLDQTRSLISDAQFTWGERRVMGVVALITLGGYGLAAWVSGRLLRTSAELIDALLDGVEANVRTAELIELNVVPALNRIATALERESTSATPDAQVRAAETARGAIAAGRWTQAERLIDAFARDFPQAPERSRLPGELGEARRALIDDLRSQLDDAREAGNPEAVIDSRDALTEHLRGAELSALDQEVVRWLYPLIQSRARSPAMRDDVAALAERVADSFGDTPEAAKLRAALPRLRRYAGLCPRCARPYRGRDDACPQCMDSHEPEAIS